MKNKIVKLFIALFLVGFTVLVFFTPAVNVLSVSNRKAPDEKIISKAAYRDGFVISYTHSVNKGRVHDFYHILADKQLELNETVFVSYGAGIPEPEETEGADFTVLENGYQISNLHRVVPELMMAVGIIANHSITICETEYFLTDYFAPQTSLILEIKRISLFNIIKSTIQRRNLNGRK